MPHYSRIMTREIWLFSVHRFARASLVYYVFYLKYAIFITLSCAACRQPVYAQQIQLLIPVVTVIISSFFFNFNKPLINYVCMCVCLEDDCAHVTSSFGNFYHVHYCSLMPLTLIMCTPGFVCIRGKY